MRTFTLLSCMFLVGITAFAQENLIIKSEDLPRNKGISPSNIYVSGQDIIDLGILFEEYNLVTEVSFGINDEIYNLSNTNKYLIKYDKDKSEVILGCLVPTNDMDTYRFDQTIIMTIPRMLDAMGAPITQGE